MDDLSPRQASCSPTNVAVPSFLEEAAEGSCSPASVAVPSFLDEAVEDKRVLDADVDDVSLSGDPVHTSLKELFDSIGQPVEDASRICGLIRPFVVKCIESTDNPHIMHEILAFLDDGILKSSSSEENCWSCSNGQVHAIVHLLNRNQFLFEEKQSITDEEEEFLMELSKLAHDS
jgi:hypothetical protein